MIKILFIVTQSEIGGAQKFLIETAPLLNKQKYQILVAAGLKDGTLFTELAKLNIRNTGIPRLKRVPSIFDAIAALKEILNLLKEENPDVLFLCSTTAGLIGSVSTLFYKKPSLKVIYRIGGWSFLDPRPSLLNHLLVLLEKMTALLKDKIIINSQADLKAALEKRICPAEKLALIHNGIDPSKLDFYSRTKARQKLSKIVPNLNLSESTPLVGCIANLYKTKGISCLIKAAAKISDPDNLKFLVIGQGQERENLLCQIKKLRLKGKFFLTGAFSDAWRFLKAFDVYVLPSLKEGFPWVILEAASANLPVVATKVGALPEIISHRKQGLLVEPAKTLRLSEALKWMFRNKKEARNMALALQRKVRQGFTVEKMVEETENLINRLSSG